MNIYAFPPIAAVLDAAYGVVAGLSDLLTPLFGGVAAALAIIAITLLVRTVLIPVGASHVRAEFTRRRLAPQLRELQRRHKATPAVLQQKTMELYAAENASPFAGMLPALAQAPVLSIVYGLFILPAVNGHVNALLAAHLFTVPLGSSLLQFLGAGAGAGILWPGIAVFAALLAVMSVVAFLSRRAALRQLALAEPLPASGRQAAVDPAADAAARAHATTQRRVSAALSWAPFISVVVAGFVPLAAALYLAVTTAWTLVERAWLRKHFSRLEAIAAGAN